MKPSKVAYLYFVAFYCLISCTNTQSIDSSASLAFATLIQKSSQHPNMIPSNGHVIILPNTGCGGCITEGEKFMYDNIENKSVVFVLTGFPSMKAVKLRYDTLLTHHNVLLDRDNLFYQEGLESIYPYAYALNNGSLSNRKE